MIHKILGANLLLDPEGSLCKCMCECYPHTRDSDYQAGYGDGTAQGANDNAMEA